LLAIYAFISVLLMVIVIAKVDIVFVISLCPVYLFMSIIFPTIFTFGLKNTGSHTKRASSFLVMEIVGGAICPIIMGAIVDDASMPW
jgi:MFS transporter, FHS family, L-fucose permease